MFDLSPQDAIGVVGLLVIFVWVAWFADHIRRGKK